MLRRPLHRFWSSVIEPVLRAVAPAVIVEIGADEGANTAKILEYCESHGAVAHVIDPLPRFTVSDWQAKYGDALIFHRELSLKALPRIEAMNVVLIDGDHNWYTVFNELKLIEASAEGTGTAIPVVLLHDVDWPYGRRDLYYAPETIPEGYRHPYELAGLRPGKTALSKSGGLNANVANAVAENTERNGVRTAIEDFVSQSTHDFHFVVVPGWHGLGILAERSYLRANGPLEELLTSFGSEEFLFDQCRRIEQARVRTMIRAHEKQRLLKRRVRELERQRADDRELGGKEARRT
jgi:hypothetical protein